MRSSSSGSARLATPRPSACSSPRRRSPTWGPTSGSTARARRRPARARPDLQLRPRDHQRDHDDRLGAAAAHRPHAAGEWAWETVSFPLPTGFNLPAMQPVTFPGAAAVQRPGAADRDLPAGRRPPVHAALLPPAAGPELRDRRDPRPSCVVDSDKGPPVTPERRVRPAGSGADHPRQREGHAATRGRRTPPPAATSASTAASCTTAIRTTRTATTRATAAPWAPTASP